MKSKLGQSLVVRLVVIPISPLARYPNILVRESATERLGCRRWDRNRRVLLSCVLLMHPFDWHSWIWFMSSLRFVPQEAHKAHLLIIAMYSATPSATDLNLISQPVALSLLRSAWVNS